MTPSPPRLATFVGETFFVQALAEHLLRVYEQVENPASLSHVTVCVPTRRGVQALKHAFFSLRPTGLCLPRILTIAELSPLTLLPPDAPYWQHPPTPILTQEARLWKVTHLLVELSQQSSSLFPHPLTVQEAMRYATSFLSLRDDFARAGLSYHALRPLFAGEYAAHWEDALAMFYLLMQQMEEWLATEHTQEALPQHQVDIEAIATYWQAHPHPHPFIIAGSTGSTPTTAALMQAVYQLPHGSIILPALDIWMDEASFAALPPTHAQYHLQQLLQKLHLTRADVTHLHAGESKQGLLASYMLRPNNDTYYAAELPTEAKHIAYLACDDELSETESIALAIRAALYEGAQRIIVISDDDAFNMRLHSLLAKEHITVDISSGIPLAHSPAIHFMLLVAELLFMPFRSSTLLATLRHPVCGQEAHTMHALADFLDIRMLRGMHPYNSFATLMRALHARTTLPDAARPALPLLQNCIEGLAALQQGLHPVAHFITQHIHALQQVGEPALQQESIAFLEGLTALIPPTLRCSPHEYSRILWEQCAGKRASLPLTHAPVHIIGALELRLQQADLLIVPRMNEGVFPSSIPADPWLGYGMRRQLGLNYQERKIGLAAHDMATMLRFPRVLFTRSMREGTSHTRASRFFERLKLLGSQVTLTHATHLLTWQRATHAQQQASLPAFTIPSPPCPPVAVRPRRIGATMCESFLQNPFKVYASHICRLRVRDPLDDDLNPAIFGEALHRALHLATAAYHPHQLEEYFTALEACFATELASLVPADTAQFHHARLQRMLERYRQEEIARAPTIAQLGSEENHHRAYTLQEGTEIELTARIDRIEHLHDGSVVLIDHKTGTPPSLKDVQSLQSCQLLVAGLLVHPHYPISGLAYFEMSGKQKETRVNHLIYDIHHSELAWIDWEATEQALLSILHHFIEHPEARYPYSPSKQRHSGYDALAHLARRGEWC